MHIIWIIFRNHRTAASSGELADKQSSARESEQDGNDEMERERERGPAQNETKALECGKESLAGSLGVEIVA